MHKHKVWPAARVRAASLMAASILIGAVLSGCAGRSPDPVAVVQPTDHMLDCTAIYAEAESNNKKIADLGGEQGAKVAQNVAAGVAGIFIWPLWFAMDLQGTAGKEIEALQSRQNYLATLAGQKECAQPLVTIAEPEEKAPPPKKLNSKGE